MAIRLSPLAAMREALAQDGAMLVFDQRLLSRGYYIRHASGFIERCTMLADRLTYGKNAAVVFSHRTSLEIVYTPKREIAR